MRRNNYTGQNGSLVEVSKKLFLTAEVDSWLLRSVIFLKSTKIPFSCHIIVSAREVLLQFVPKVSLDPKKHFTCAWRVQKTLRKKYTI